MKTLVVATTLFAYLLPSNVVAKPLSFGGNVTVTSNYLTDGLSESGNSPAIQPYLEVSKNGFYAGAWATNLNGFDGNRAELDLTFGYRNQTPGGLEYDLNYTQFLYDRTREASSELAVSLGIPVTDKLLLAAEVTYDPSAKSFGENAGVEFTLADDWTLHTEIGRASKDEDVNFGAGVSYALNDRTAVDVQVQDTTTTNPLFAVSLTYDFGAPTD